MMTKNTSIPSTPSPHSKPPSSDRSPNPIAVTSCSPLKQYIIEVFSKEAHHQGLDLTIHEDITFSNGNEMITVPLVVITAPTVIVLSSIYPHAGEIIGNETGQWIILSNDGEFIELQENPYQKAEKIRAFFIQHLITTRAQDDDSISSFIINNLHVCICLPDGSIHNPRQLHPHSRQWFHVITPSLIPEWLRTHPRKKMKQHSNPIIEKLQQEITSIITFGNDPKYMEKKKSSQDYRVNHIVLKKNFKWFCDICPASCKGGRMRQWQATELEFALKALKIHYLLLEYYCIMKGSKLTADVICYIRSFFFHAARKFNLQLTKEQKRLLTRKIEELKKKLEPEETKKPLSWNGLRRE